VPFKEDWAHFDPTWPKCRFFFRSCSEPILLTTNKTKVVLQKEPQKKYFSVLPFLRLGRSLLPIPTSPVPASQSNTSVVGGAEISFKTASLSRQTAHESSQPHSGWWFRPNSSSGHCNGNWHKIRNSGDMSLRAAGPLIPRLAESWIGSSRPPRVYPIARQKLQAALST
jgi:hypothetical protein